MSIFQSTISPSKNFMLIPNDTSPDAEHVQIELLRRAGPAGRFRKMASLSHSVVKMSKRAIARQNPTLSDFEQSMLFVTLHYGIELERKIRKFLINRGHGE
ncbi:MAG: hypothetical protein GF401_15120 [Chitinivibrionales bacterium]|nr:hypothetical protein [Chitinivibrionales bacterium]